MADPGFDARINVIGTLNALEAAARAGAKRFVFTSTGGAIYGEGRGREDELPFAEAAALRALLGLRPEQARRRGLPRALRARAWPHRGDAAAGERLRPPPGPRAGGRRRGDLLRAGARRRQPTVFGDGKQTRDYVYVADVVAALLAARDVGRARALQRRHGRRDHGARARRADRGADGPRATSSPTSRPARDGEVERTALDTSLAAKELGFKAERDLAAGLEQTISDDR